jgi:hypothetical protein
MTEFDKLCEEVLSNLQEGKMKKMPYEEGMPKVGEPAHVDGAKPRLSEMDDEDEDYDDMDESCGTDHDDLEESDDMDDEEFTEGFKEGYKEAMKKIKELAEAKKVKEMDDEDEDEDEDLDESDDMDDDEEMEEGFPNVGAHAHIDSSDLHKKQY